MWPVRRKPVTDPVLIAGDHRVVYRSRWDCWELDYEGILFSYQGPAFDLRVVEQLDLALSWVVDQPEAISTAVQEQVAGWCPWEGEPTLVSIDITDLVAQGRIEASFCGDDSWGDLGVTLIIEQGSIVGSTIGD